MSTSYNTRLFGNSLASNSIETPRLGESIPRIGDPLGCSHVSFQKQNHEGVVRAQRGQYCAMAEPVCDVTIFF
ncbi:hypothetical protein DVH24_012360 [Malus domestica]|uniref:Uncharacterized protein n=1 Tax=Malus domestica TaxID=3750 RepID=A0A498HMI0_MALDO|nr:hypothetical protein DVH24_012360 [Malus domestica]